MESLRHSNEVIIFVCTHIQSISSHCDASKCIPCLFLSEHVRIVADGDDVDQIYICIEYQVSRLDVIFSLQI